MTNIVQAQLLDVEPLSGARGTYWRLKLGNGQSMNVFDQGQANRAAQLKGAHVEITTVPSKDGRFQNFQEIKPTSLGTSGSPAPLQAVTEAPVPSQRVSDGDRQASIERQVSAKIAFEALSSYGEISEEMESWALRLAEKIHGFISQQEPPAPNEIAQQVNEIMGTEAVKAGPDW